MKRSLFSRGTKNLSRQPQSMLRTSIGHVAAILPAVILAFQTCTTSSRGIDIPSTNTVELSKGSLGGVAHASDFVLTTNATGQVTITGFNHDYAGELSIPNTLNGRRVVAIAGGAFFGRTGLTSITIPDGVTEIEPRTFARCTDLTSITIPESVTEIGYEAFAGCTNLTSITIPNGVTGIETHTFWDCTGLTNVTISASVVEIDGYAFLGCTDLTTIMVDTNNAQLSSMNGVLFNKGQTILIQCPSGKSGNYTIPDGVTEIRWVAFSRCADLTSITIPDSVNDIGSDAFYGCTGLTSITIPGGVNEIEPNAFNGCTNLVTIIVDSDNAAFSSTNGIMFNKGQTELLRCPSKTTGSYTVPNGVSKIEDFTFADCTGLTSITLPDSVTEIGEGAFSGCTGLTSIAIPNSITKIEDTTFSGCTGLTTITIPKGVTYVGHAAFSHCTGLMGITIPKGVSWIPFLTFQNCTNLTSITFPDSITEITHSALSGCTGLTSVYFEGDAPTTGSFFDDCTNATVYYRAGTKGWGATFCRRPTAVWKQ